MKYLLLLVCALCACESPTGDDGSAVDVQGDWLYTATQVTPQLNLEGVFGITEQDGASFSGTAAFTEIDAQGTRRTRAGAINGRVVGGDVVDMDVYVDAEIRRHVGRVAADSMTGSWSISGTSLNGTFRTRRAP
jgi:hypothetical protein